MAKKEFTGVNLTTPLCRLAFPFVFTKTVNLNGKEEYSVAMVFDKDADLSKLKGALLQAAKNEFGPDVDLKTLDLKRIRDGNTMGREEFKDKWVVRAKTGLGQPGVVDKQLNKIIDPSEIYSGVYAHVNITAKAYTLPSKGVTFYLNHVQKVKDGEPFATRSQPKDVFEELEIPAGAGDGAVASDPELNGMFS
jgi:hypothetical protein